MRRGVVVCVVVLSCAFVAGVWHFRQRPQPPPRSGPEAVLEARRAPLKPAVRATPQLDKASQQQTLFREAQAAFEAKDFARSIELFDRLLADCSDPQLRLEALRLRGHAYRQTGDIARAKADFLQVVSLASDPKVKAEVLARYSYLCLKEKNDADARAGFLKVAELSPDPEVQADALLRSSYIALRDDKLTSNDKAMLFRQVAERFPQSKEGRDATLRYARLISAMPDQPLDARRKAFRAVVERYPGSAEAKEAEMSLASVEWRESENNPSIEKKQEVEAMYRTLSSSAATAEDRANATMNVAALNLELERLQHSNDADYRIDYSKVIELCDAALATPGLKPADAATAALIRAESLHYSGQQAEAGQEFQKLIQTWGSDPTCATQVAFSAYMQAMNFVQLKDYARAAEAFHNVVVNYANAPNFAGNNIAASSLTWIANLSIQSGDFGAAQRAIAQLEQQYAATPEAAQLTSLKNLLQIKSNTRGN